MLKLWFSLQDGKGRAVLKVRQVPALEHKDAKEGGNLQE
jgi:hypothetical protein